jgi:predicted phage gp36 major capsid-like protein
MGRPFQQRSTSSRTAHTPDKSAVDNRWIAGEGRRAFAAHAAAAIDAGGVDAQPAAVVRAFVDVATGEAVTGEATFALAR